MEIIKVVLQVIGAGVVGFVAHQMWRLGMVIYYGHQLKLSREADKERARKRLGIG